MGEVSRVTSRDLPCDIPLVYNTHAPSLESLLALFLLFLTLPLLLFTPDFYHCQLIFDIPRVRGGDVERAGEKERD